MSRRKVIPVVYAKLDGDTAGLAYHPAFGDKEIKIKIDSTIRGKERLRVLLHERLHILKPSWQERTVDEVSTVLSEFAWVKGYRRVAQ